MPNSIKHLFKLTKPFQFAMIVLILILPFQNCSSKLESLSFSSLAPSDSNEDSSAAVGLISFIASMSTIEIGQVTTLSWKTNKVKKLILNPGDVNVTAETFYILSPVQSGIYTLTAETEFGAETKSVSITVTIPPVPTWKIEPNPIFRFGTTDSMDLMSTLPQGLDRGGVFSVDLAGTPLLAGMQFKSSGILSVGTAAVGSAASVKFIYQEGGIKNRTVISAPVTMNVIAQTVASGNGQYVTQNITSPFAIVYVRVPRTASGVIRAAGSNPAVPINGQFDQFPETSHWVDGFTGPGQLVYRDGSGIETVLFDCINQNHTPIVNGVADPGGGRSCLPMDPSVSFDGKKVIFSVLYSNFVASTFSSPIYSDSNANPLTKLATDPIGAQLYEVDLTNFSVRPLHYNRLGDFDTAPIYIPWDESDPSDTDRIMYTSNQARELPSSMLFGNSPANSFNQILLQLYIADKDGKNNRRTGVHDRDGVLHPFVMTDGRVIFTTWSLSHMGAFRRNNSSARGAGSPQNEAWMASVNSKGGFLTAEYGRHGKYRQQNTGNVNTVGMHFFTETSDRKWLCYGDYYRSNNKGAGETNCFQREPVGVEGPYVGGVAPESAFMPRYFQKAFLFGSNSDVGDNDGGTRDPIGIPGNNLMITFAKGNACLRPDFAVYNPNSTCDLGIYRTTTIPSTAAQLIPLVNNPNFHEFMARVAEPYQFTYGIAKPAFAGHQRKSPNGKCYIASSSLESEAEPLLMYSFNQNGASARDCAVQGCKSRDLPMTAVKAIRFWEVLAHDSKFIHNSSGYANSGQPNILKSLAGNRMKLLGDAPVNADGSFAAEVPCETSYLMTGVTADGETILRDQIPQSLRKGEIRTCTGCHLHSGRPGRAIGDSIAGKELDKHLLTPGSGNISFISTAGGFREMWKGQLQNQVTVDASGAATTVTEAQVYEYNKHIKPILISSCVSCHDGRPTTVLDLRDLSTREENGFLGFGIYHEQNIFMPLTSWNILAYKKPTNPSGDWEIPRLSKYIHMAFSVESLLYWKIAGQRKDGRSDAKYTTDLDYGVLTPSDPHQGVNESHIRIFKNWIDSGAYLHQGILPMDYKPPQ